MYQLAGWVLLKQNKKLELDVNFYYQVNACIMYASGPLMSYTARIVV